MAKEEKPEGSGIDYSARKGQPARDIEIRPDNPFALTASNQLDNRDGALYSPGTSQQVLDAQQRQWNINTAHDSFSAAKYPGGQYGPPDATADFGLSVADRASDAKYGGVLSDEQYGYWQTSEAARNPDSTLISEDELRYYGSGGVDGWDVALEQYGVPDNLGGTLRDALISQVESERDTGTRFAWLARNAPAAVAAIGANGMDPDDVATAHNVYVAQQAANRAVEMVDEGLPMAAAQLMNVLPVQQRIIASALLHSEIQKREQAATEQQAQVDEDARQQSLKPQFNPATGQLSTPTVTPTGGVVGSTGTSSAVSGMDILNWLLEATLWGVETVTHVARFYGTTTNTVLFEGGEFGGVVTPASGEQQITDSFASRIGAMWQATEENFISRNGYDEMVAEFGKDTADLAMGLYDAERSDDPDAVEKYKASLASNPQAVASIQAALSGNNIGNSPLAEAMVQLYAKDQGNYGNLIAGMVGLEPGTIPFSMARDAVNVASWFAFDPLVWAGMAGKAFRASKYGLQVIEQMGGMGNVLRASRLGPWAERAVLGRVTGFNGVRAEYDEFGQALKAYQEAVDVGDTAKAAAILKNARKRWMGKRNSLLGEADWNVGKEHKLYSADEWATHFDDIDKAGEILAGKRVALEQPVSTMDEAFGQINKAMKPTPDEEVLAHEGMGMAVKSAVGQQVRRQLYMPHVTQAQAMLRAQTIAWGKTVAPAYIDRAVQALERTIQVDGWEYMNVEGKMNALRNLISNDEAVAKALGLELGDWKLIDGQMQRTVLGRFADRLYDHGEGARRVGMILGLFKRSKSKDGVQYLKVKGWKRDRTLFDVPGRARGARETWARLVTRLPNLPHGLNVSSAEHADEVYRMAMAAGLGRGGSNLIRLAWVEGNAASRQNMMIGLTRTFTAAMGLDAVDPHLATRVMREMTGLRAKEEYAANAIPNEAGTRATVREEVTISNNERRQQIETATYPQDARLAEIDAALNAPVGPPGGLSAAERKALSAERTKLRKNRRAAINRQLKKIDNEADVRKAIAEEQKPGGRLHAATMSVNPSVDGNGKASALYMGQTSDYMAVPNIKAMDQYAARQSYLNGFLFQGTAGTNVTEAWVLGSLYGPRFAIRNAFEDIAMYVLTGGKMGKFFKGRRLDEAIDESMARVNKNYLAHKQRADNAQKEFDRVSAEFRAGRADPNQLVAAKQENDVAQTLLAQAQNERTLFGASKYGQHKKRGIVRTAILNISERLSWTPAGRERDGVVASMARLLAPTTSTAARREALEKGPEAMIELAEKAVLRQNVVWNRPGWRKIVPARAEKVEDLTPRQLQYLRDEEDFLRSSHGLTYKDMAAESAAHLMDGSIPTLTNGGRYVFDERGNLMRRISVDEGYQSVKINSNVLSPQQARGMMARLGYMADKYGLNQAAMHQLPDYWKALNAVGGPDVKALDDIVDIVLGVAQQSRDWPYVASRFRLADDLGAKAHVRRMMDDMSAAFTRRGTGSEKDVMELWNQDLWISLRHTRNGKITFGLEKPSGEPAITEIDFLLGKYDTPSSVLVHGSEGWVDVPAKDMWSSAAWEQMGRSMSRMSRNPIFYSNYLESRQAMRPLERKYAEIFGEEYARKKFADAAAERAYELTMSFVDNPAIRTNLSWQVRNIARYYRAQEDFVRRVTRMVKFDPVSIQKANLAWQAQQDFGFVHRDDFGNDYFMYPGSASVMSVFQSFFGLIGVDNLKVAHAPMAFSGNVQWLSPSLDLGAAAPTLSSPWMAVTLQPLLRSMPFANDWFKAVERYAFGDVSSNMDYTDLNLGDGPAENVAAAFYQTLPPSVKKLIAIGEGAFGNELPGSFGYKMTAKTMVAMAAAGQLPSQRDIADEKKRQEWLDLMGRRTFEMSILSFVFGFFAPASPQYTEDTLSFSAREQGLTMLAPGLREGIMASVKAGMSWEEAYITWMRANPKQAGVLVSSSESIGGAYVEATWNNVDFIESNRALFDEAPLGVTFFVPDSQGAGGGEEGNAAWRAMKQFGLRQYREMQPVADDILMAQGRLEKMILESQIGDMEAEIPHYDANGEITDVWRRHEDEKDRAKDRLNALYPSSDQGYELTDSDEYRVTADQIVTANRGLAGKSPMARAAAPLVEAYTQLRYDYNQFLTGGGPSGIGRDDMKENFKAEWQRVVAAWWADAAGRYPQDRAEKMVSVFSRSLSTGWKDITLEGEQ